MPPTHQEPWERLSEILAANRVEQLRPFLEALPPGETARALSRIPERDQARILKWLGPEEAAEILEGLSNVQAAGIIDDLPADQAAAIVEELPSNEKADLLAELREEDAAAILAEMEPEAATETRELLRYPPNTAGGIMITEYLAYHENKSVGDVVTDLRDHGGQYTDYAIQYTYVTTTAGVLVGVLRVRALLLSRSDEPVSRLMIRNPLRVRSDSPITQLKRLFDEHPFMGIPVVDSDDRLVGVVRRAAVEQAMSELATEDFLKVTGLIGEEELRSMPVMRRSSRRLAWLSINIVLNIIAASVIAFYQETLAAVIALAVFLPIISDMSGCSGNQAVAVSIRELALGLVKPYEFLRVVFKEGAVGIINGMVLGILLGAVAVAWKGNVFLGLVVGAALMLNTVLSVTLGGLVPLGLKAMRLDPALASGPILTTVTDMCGFLMVLGFASTLLPRLVA